MVMAEGGPTCCTYLHAGHDTSPWMYTQATGNMYRVCYQYQDLASDLHRVILNVDSQKHWLLCTLAVASVPLQ